MTTRYSPGCKDEKAHQCDMCENSDGRPTLYWAEKDFDLCYECLINLNNEYIPKPILSTPTLPVDSIILVSRLKVSETLRNKVFERDGYACKLCGEMSNLCLDHVKPFSQGGKTEELNLQTLCRSCNSKKRDK